jgi:hypothetical protein
MLLFQHSMHRKSALMRDWRCPKKIKISQSCNQMHELEGDHASRPHLRMTTSDNETLRWSSRIQYYLPKYMPTLISQAIMENNSKFGRIPKRTQLHALRQQSLSKPYLFLLRISSLSKIAVYTWVQTTDLFSSYFLRLRIRIGWKSSKRVLMALK